MVFSSSVKSVFCPIGSLVLRVRVGILLGTDCLSQMTLGLERLFSDWWQLIRKPRRLISRINKNSKTLLKIWQGLPVRFCLTSTNLNMRSHK